MAFVAGLLLFYMNEEPAFQMFCRLLGASGPNLRRCVAASQAPTLVKHLPSCGRRVQQTVRFATGKPVLAQNHNTHSPTQLTLLTLWQAVPAGAGGAQGRAAQV